MSDSTWQILDRLSIILGVLAFIGTTYSACMWLRHFQREKRMREMVVIRLIDAGTRQTLYELPYRPPHRIISRAEVLGLLGMIPSAEAGKRFEWAWLHTPDFMLRLEEVHQARLDLPEIPLTSEEYAQLRLVPNA